MGALIQTCISLLNAVIIKCWMSKGNPVFNFDVELFLATFSASVLVKCVKLPGVLIICSFPGIFKSCLKLFLHLFLYFPGNLEHVK